MKVSIVQMDVRLADPEYNFSHAEELIGARPPKSRMSSAFRRRGTRDSSPGRTWRSCRWDGVQVKKRIGSLAKELGVHIVAGSVANVKGDGVYNTATYLTVKEAVLVEYDKTHLFTPMG